MKRVILILSVLCGAALAFVLCGGVDMARSVSAALSNPPAPISVANLPQ